MEIIIVLILIGLGACLIGSLASKADAKSKEKFNNKINGWQSDYYDELCAACREQGIAMPSKSILDKDEIWVSYQGMGVYSPGYLWEDGKNIVYCPDLLNQCGRSIRENLLIIPFEQIMFYTKDGNISYTNKILNDGKGVSVSGAIVGGLIAGDAGAIIGAGKDAHKIKSVTETHDEVHTFIYYGKDNENVKIADVKGQKFYAHILQILPSKEYNYVKNATLDSTLKENGSAKDSLIRLKDLYDSGLIDETEYKTKKEEILHQL